MTSSLKQFGKESLIYGFGYVMIRFVSFLLMPLYTNSFSQADYGTLTLVFTFIGLALLFYVSGMGLALMKFYVRPDQDRRTVVTTIFMTLFVSSVFLSSLLVLFARPLSKVLFGEPQPVWMAMTALILVMDTISVRGQVLLRMNNRAVTYTLFALANVTVAMVGNIILVARLNYGVTGAILATLLAALCSFLLILPTVVREIHLPSFDPALLKKMLLFGLPFLPGAFFQFIMDLADRYLIDWLMGRDMVGLYSAGYKVGSLMLILQSGFNLGWQPYFLKKENDPEAPQLFARIATYFALGLTFIWTIMIMFVDRLVRLEISGITLIGSEFWSSTAIVPLIMLGYIFLGFYDVLMPGIFYHNKSHLVSVYRGIGAASNVILNLLLIPRWGIMGAAWATCISFGLMSTGLFFQTQKLFYIPFQWSKIAFLFALAGSMLVLKIWLTPGLGMQILLFVLYTGIIAFSVRKDIRNFFRR